MSEPIHAEIRGGAYHVGTISAVTLPSLCLLLLKAGYDPDAPVEAYRDGPQWDIRAVTIRGAAAQARGYNDDIDGGGVMPLAAKHAPATPPQASLAHPKYRRGYLTPPTFSGMAFNYDCAPQTGRSPRSSRMPSTRSYFGSMSGRVTSLIC
jgi:hypothetical protein